MNTFSQNYFPYLLLLLATDLGFVAAAPQWYTANGTIFLIETDSKYNFLQAVDECARRDLQLVIVENAEKHIKLVQIIQSLPKKPNALWIDLHDEFSTEINLTRPFYSLSTGRQNTFASWIAQEPNNGGGKEHCVEMVGNPDYLWNDISCEDTRHGYVCEEHQLTTAHKKNLKLRRDLTNFTLTNTITDFKIQIEHINDIQSKERESIKYLMDMWKKSVEEITSDQAEEPFEKITAKTLHLIEDAQLSAEETISGVIAEHASRLEGDSTFIDGVLSHN